MKAWDGRFTGKTAPLMERFSASIHFDQVLYPYDIEGSVAYAEMLQRIGILREDEKTSIVAALGEIKKEIENGQFAFSDELEDIHMHIEARLIEKVGDLGKKLHTGRSRNDQVSVDVRLFLKDKLPHVDGQLGSMMKSLLDKAETEQQTMMPGYTHTQRAQVVPFAHYLFAYFYMLKRDRERLREAFSRMDTLPLGSGALAGSTIPLDRDFLRKRLGFSRISENSMDAVSDRDFILDTLYSLSMIMLHLSRLSEDLILFSTEEFSFVSLPDELCTGSSLMPHKKNPDALELVRGRTSRTLSDLFGMFSILKGLPMTYNRDLQEDKELLFHGVATAGDALAVMTLAVGKMVVRRDRMEQAVMASFMPAVEMSEYLALKGVPFREAHRIVGTMVKECEGKGRLLWELTIEEMRAHSSAFEDDVFAYIKPQNILNNRKTAGGASYGEVEKEIATEKVYLDNWPGIVSSAHGMR